MPAVCRSGEIGIRRGLKIPRLHGRAGSTPASGTRKSAGGRIFGFHRASNGFKARPDRRVLRREIADMRKIARRTALFAILALVLPLALPSVASAQMREFTGKVDKITKAGKLIVDNRKGDKVSFVKIDTTEVTGEKTEWDKVKKDDWVTVSWKMIDKPRKAYKVNVMPPPEDD